MEIVLFVYRQIGRHTVSLKDWLIDWLIDWSIDWFIACQAEKNRWLFSHLSAASFAVALESALRSDPYLCGWNQARWITKAPVLLSWIPPGSLRHFNATAPLPSQWEEKLNKRHGQTLTTLILGDLAIPPDTDEGRCSRGSILFLFSVLGEWVWMFWEFFFSSCSKEGDKEEKIWVMTLAKNRSISHKIHMLVVARKKAAPLIYLFFCEAVLAGWSQTDFCEGKDL